MELVTKSLQIDDIAKKLNIYKTDVEIIISNYISYLQRKVNVGESVKILNICYLNNQGEATKVSRNRETLGYIATELADMLNLGSSTVLRVLNALEDSIIDYILDNKSYTLRGLVRIRISENGTVSIRKSTRYSGNLMRVTILGSFKRKVAKRAS